MQNLLLEINGIILFHNISDRLGLGNYRPISILNLIATVITLMIHRRLFDFIRWKDPVPIQRPYAEINATVNSYIRCYQEPNNWNIVVRKQQRWLVMKY